MRQFIIINPKTRFFFKTQITHVFQLNCQKFVGYNHGGEGSRTPVRKLVYCGLYHHSLFFDIPSAKRLKAGS